MSFSSSGPNNNTLPKQVPQKFHGSKLHKYQEGNKTQIEMQYIRHRELTTSSHFFFFFKLWINKHNLQAKSKSQQDDFILSRAEVFMNEEEKSTYL
jgi:hypothetical protein